MPIKGLGWKPPLPNAHKKWFKDFCRVSATNPNVVDLGPECPPIYDQGQLGSCTSFSSCSLAQFLILKSKLWDFVPSFLAEYYWTRLGEGTQSQDAGASVQDAVNTLHTWGLANSALWWYNVNKFAVKPNHDVANDAGKHKIGTPVALQQNLNELQTCLADGYPFVFGFTVYQSFETIGSDGIMPLPKPNEQILGGHAVMAVGYNNTTQYVKVRNSWGVDFGLSGYFLMPYSYLLNTNYCSDFWTANSVTELP